MSIRAIVLNVNSDENTVELALPGCRCCPLQGEAAAGCFGGK